MLEDDIGHMTLPRTYLHLAHPNCTTQGEET